MVEIVIESLRLLFEVLDVSIDVILTPRSIKTALIERVFQTFAKCIGFAFDSIQQAGNFAIADAIRLAGHLTMRVSREHRYQQWNGERSKERFFYHGQHFFT